jgi:putative flippase GtrA
VRFVRFNAVGVLGFVVQLAVLALLVRAGVHYLAATAIAVEAALLHNFAWHERWTWRDRAATGGRGRRLLRFHLLNGSVSLGGNLLLMPILVRLAGLSIVPANAVAVLACAVVNFAGADAAVFVRPAGFREPSAAPAPRR